MTNKPDTKKPALTPRAAAALAERKAREAESLRENLRKRKAQRDARDPKPKSDG